MTLAVRSLSPVSIVLQENVAYKQGEAEDQRIPTAGTGTLRVGTTEDRESVSRGQSRVRRIRGDEATARFPD